MASLEKVIKVTQEQYDILASGGTVGDYTGLDEDYLYLVQDNSAPIIDITDGITQEHYDAVASNYATMLLYNGRMYTPVFYNDYGNNMPCYYVSI